jgi:PDZ domain-containing protein
MADVDEAPPQPSPLASAPGEPATDAGAEPPWWGPYRRFVFLVPLALLAFVLYVIPLPYFVFSPGNAVNVEPLIHVRGHATYPSQGRLLLTTVLPARASAYDLILAWHDPAKVVYPESALVAPGQTDRQADQFQLSLMDTSKIDATYVALSRYAGYPGRHGTGALIESVYPGTPADGRLFAGDVVLSANGRVVADLAALRAAIGSAGYGHAVRFLVRPLGVSKSRTVSVTPGHLPGLDRPAIGVRPIPNFPFPVSINSQGIGGPSAGLMWTLGLIDVLTPGDLTGGRTIAGTGTISTDGTVGPIGGVQEKVVAAERAGAMIFFASVQDAPDARAVAHGMVVVAVATYQDAVHYLQTHRG